MPQATESEKPQEDAAILHTMQKHNDSDNPARFTIGCLQYPVKPAEAG